MNIEHNIKTERFWVKWAKTTWYLISLLLLLWVAYEGYSFGITLWG